MTPPAAPVTFGLDFDGTFAAAPALFREFVALIRKHGHDAVMVTQRCAQFEAEILAVTELPDLRIIYASGQSKENAAALAGVRVDVWVDDNPFSIGTALFYRGCAA